MDYHQVMAQFAKPLADVAELQVPADWGQGRALFGGMAGALALAHLQQVIPAELPLRSLTISFVAPLAPGVASASRRVLRQGKSVLQAQVELSQQGQPALVLLASFGAARPSQLLVSAPPLPPVADAQYQSMPNSPQVPEFTRHFDYQLCDGGWPFSASQLPRLQGRLRFEQPANDSLPADDRVDAPALLALIDAWWPVSLSLSPVPAPASSLTWTLELLPGWQGFSRRDWWPYRAEIEHGSEGYHHIAAQCWTPAGQLAAISRQTVTVFA